MRSTPRSLGFSAIALFLVACGGGEVVAADAEADADGPEADAPAPPLGWCGQPCNWATQYCFANGVGQPPPGQGECEALPATCVSNPTCACLVGALDAACASCKDIDGGLIEGCWEP